MASLIIVEPPAIWGGTMNIRTMRVAFGLAVHAQVVAVRSACQGKNNCVIYSSYIVRGIAKAISHDIGGDLIRMKGHLSHRSHIEVMWQAVQDAVAKGDLETVVLIDSVANEAVAKLFFGAKRLFNLSPGEVVRISENGDVTMLITSPG